MLFTKYVKYNLLEYLDHNENEFIIQSNINNHFYYKTREDEKDKTIDRHTNKLKNGYC